MYKNLTLHVLSLIQTADNDYVVSFSVAKEIWKRRAYLRDNFGLTFLNDFYLRVCLSESFMDGALLNWKTTENDAILEKTGKYHEYHPYADFFYGDVDPVSGLFIDEVACGYEVSSYRPATRLSVYKENFSVSVPKDYEMVLASLYGPNWRKPGKKKAHGYSNCGGVYLQDRKYMRIWNRNGVDSKWINHWNGLLNNATQG